MAGESMYATTVLGRSLLLGWLLLLPLLLLLLLQLPLLLLLLLGVMACLANAESAGKLPLHSELSTRAPARIRDAKVVIGWMLSRAPVDGGAPRMTISIDSSSEGLSRTCEVRVRQRPTYSPNGSLGFWLVAIRSSRFGTGSRLKEYYSRNA